MVDQRTLSPRGEDSLDIALVWKDGVEGIFGFICIVVQHWTWMLRYGYDIDLPRGALDLTRAQLG